MPMLFPNFVESKTPLGSVFTQQPYAILGATPSGAMVRTQEPYAILGATPSGAMVRMQRPYAILEGDL